MLRRFWRCFFSLLYHELAFTYDSVSRLASLGHWRAWQRATLGFLPPPDAGALLELAHGTGDLQLDLLGKGYRTVGLDLSPNMGRLAQRKLSRSYLQAQFLRGNALRLPFADAAFAAIVCTFPTAFIVSEQALAELTRVLKPEGCAVIALAGQLHGKGPASQLIRLLYRLSGQGDAPLEESAIRAQFASPGLEVASHIIAIGSSSAQIVTLGRVPPLSQEFDIGLENTDQP